MNLRKKLGTMALAGALAASAAIPAFAAVSVQMYGYMNGKYVASSHTDAFIGGIEDLGDDYYSIDFVEAEVYGRTGHIATMEINGEIFEANENGDMNVVFEYQPEELQEGLYGNPIAYEISLGGEGSGHPNSQGALVINQ